MVLIEGHLILDRVLLVGERAQILDVHLVRSSGQIVLNIRIVEDVRLEQRIIFDIRREPTIRCI